MRSGPSFVSRGPPVLSDSLGWGSSGAVSPGNMGLKAGPLRPMEGGAMTTESALGRVLVVDDEDDIRSMLGIVLSTEGWDVDEAADGREALLRAAAGRYDLVV